MFRLSDGDTRVTGRSDSQGVSGSRVVAATARLSGPPAAWRRAPPFSVGTAARRLRLPHASCALVREEAVRRWRQPALSHRYGRLADGQRVRCAIQRKAETSSGLCSFSWRFAERRDREKYEGSQSDDSFLRSMLEPHLEGRLSGILFLSFVLLVYFLLFRLTTERFLSRDSARFKLVKENHCVLVTTGSL